MSKNCIFGHFGPGLAGSFGALLVSWSLVVARGLYLVIGCGARAVSRKTPIYFIVYKLCIPFLLVHVSMTNKMPEDPFIKDEEYFAVCTDESLFVCRPRSDIFK